MSEQNPAGEPVPAGTPATDFPVVAGAGQTFDDLDSATPLSVRATDRDDDGSSARGSTDGAAVEPSEG